MKIEYDKNLKAFNSFGLEVRAAKFVEVTNIEELREVLGSESKVIFLGGGSNILFKKAPKETVVHINLKGIEITRDAKEYVEVCVAAGENWNDFVLWTIDQGLGGLENLSLIPGNVGSCPIQNIGAYGREVKDFICSVQGIDSKTLASKTYANEDCEFSYRNSIFKNQLKGKFVITHVNFKLNKAEFHKLKLNYGIIKDLLEERGIDENQVGIKEVSDVVIEIRNSKLPDPKVFGNAGSFFKNPIVDNSFFEGLKSKYPDVPNYPVGDGKIKIPAAWLIDKSGLKGYEYEGAQVNPRQPLVLMNKSGKTNGKSVWNLAEYVMKKVFENFGIELSPEVNIYPESFRFL